MGCRWGTNAHMTPKTNASLAKFLEYVKADRCPVLTIADEDTPVPTSCPDEDAPVLTSCPQDSEHESQTEVQIGFWCSARDGFLI